MKEKNTLLFINLFLFAVLTALLIMILRAPRMPARAPVRSTPSIEGLQQTAVYSIPETMAGREDVAGGKPKDLNDVFMRYSKDDAGDNMMTAWSLVNPEDKKKLAQVVDKNISETREELKADPENRKLKSKLFISETMRKLISNDFNYNFRENE